MDDGLGRWGSCDGMCRRAVLDDRNGRRNDDPVENTRGSIRNICEVERFLWNSPKVVGFWVLLKWRELVDKFDKMVKIPQNLYKFLLFFHLFCKTITKRCTENQVKKKAKV